MVKMLVYRLEPLFYVLYIVLRLGKTQKPAIVAKSRYVPVFRRY